MLVGLQLVVLVEVDGEVLVATPEVEAQAAQALKLAVVQAKPLL
jgi:hypothetical protein